MADPDLSQLDSPIGPLRDRIVVDIRTEDYVRPEGFICEANAAGNLVYQTLRGTEDQAQNGLAVGDFPGVCGAPVTLKAVRNARDSGTTVTSIVVGIV